MYGYGYGYNMSLQMQTNSTAGVPAIPVKPKAAWPKVLADVKVSLKAGELPSVLKLARGNKARLLKEFRASSTSRRLVLGNEGASILLPGPDTDSTTKTTLVDDPVWSGMSAFFRLFSVMSALPEEDFPRACIADFMSVWSELWDSPRGTRGMKMNAMLAFYEKYVEDLGKGVWLTKLDSDSRFLYDHLEGTNPDLCRHCGGSGEASALTRGGGGGSSSTSGKGKQATKQQPGAGGKQAGKRKPTLGKQLCYSMLEQAATCSDTECAFSHGPCPSCGSNCESASKCKKWDQATVTAKHGEIIERIKATKRRNGGRI